MKVTVCQLRNDPAELAADWAALIQHIKAEQSELVLLPEMVMAPWLAAERNVSLAAWQAAIETSENWLERLPELGAQYVLGTRPVIIEGRKLNQAFVWSEETGLIPAHQKYYLPDEGGYWEASWYDRGDGLFQVVRAGDIRIGFLICTEMWFMERARDYGRQGIEILAVPRATPKPSVDKWLVGGQAAGVISGAYCLSSNRSGECSGTSLGGLSWAIDYEGNILGTTDNDEPFYSVEIDIKSAQAAKQTYPRYVPE